MPNERIKKRAERAKRKAIKELRSAGFSVIASENGICLIGFRETEVRIVRVCLDKVADQDKKFLKSISAPPSCVRESWCRKSGASDFDKHKI